eukprot:GHVQ01024464.1.p1 GENE.GHVQ01024464.1~~GHVQ01024464.1.p1  ORF type:complete len:457 (+),score=73.23 GHVQ01024464.1:1447-2817(+)
MLVHLRVSLLTSCLRCGHECWFALCPPLCLCVNMCCSPSALSDSWICGLTCICKVVVSEEESVSLEAFSRQQRDLIALGIRCFHAKSYIATSAILDIVLAKPDYKAASGVNNVDGQIELMCLVEKLRSELNRSVDTSERCTRERDRALAEKESLQAEMTDTIQAFQAQLADSQPDGNPAYATYRTVLAEKTAHIQQLADRLMKSEHDLISTRHLLNQTHKSIPPHPSSPTTTTQAPSSASSGELKEEVKRLRKELEDFHFDKEKLRCELAHTHDASTTEIRKLQNKLKEVENAFLHVKGRLDNELVDKKSRGAEMNRQNDELSCIQRELKENQRSLEEVVAERNRFSKALESNKRELDKSRSTFEMDLRKCKTQSELDLRKYKTENELLLSQKQDLEAQVKTSLQELEDVRKAPSKNSQELEEAKEQLRIKDEELLKLTEDCANLKYRIRKLAKSS